MLTALAGVASVGLLVTHNIWLLCAVLGVQAVFDRGASAVRSGLIARLAEGGQAVAFKAYLRAVTNVGISFGALLGGVALAIDETWAYLSVFALDALTFVATAFALRLLPHVEPAPPREEGAPRLQVLRDTPYVVVSVLTGIFAIHFLVMELAIPLWIATRTSAPHSLVAVVLLVNTVSVALFQVRLSRGATTVLTSARALAVAGLLDPRWVRADRRVRRPGRVGGRGAGRGRGRGARGRRDGRLRRPVGDPDGAGAARAAGPVPGLRRDELLAVRHHRAAADRAAVHRLGPARVARARAA